jgi:hypothetical protein
MTPQQQLDAFARRELFVLIKPWCLGLGLVTCGLGGVLLFLSSFVGGPEALGSGWHAVGDAGGLRWVPFYPLIAYGGLTWLAVPLLGAGILLLTTALVLWVLTRKQSNEIDR